MFKNHPFTRLQYGKQRKTGAFELSVRESLVISLYVQSATPPKTKYVQKTTSMVGWDHDWRLYRRYRRSRHQSAIIHNAFGEAIWIVTAFAVIFTIPFASAPKRTNTNHGCLECFSVNKSVRDYGKRIQRIVHVRRTTASLASSNAALERQCHNDEEN